VKNICAPPFLEHCRLGFLFFLEGSKMDRGKWDTTMYPNVDLLARIDNLRTASMEELDSSSQCDVIAYVFEHFLGKRDGHTRCNLPSSLHMPFHGMIAVLPADLQHLVLLVHSTGQPS
jgi:hypothetical protein